MWAMSHDAPARPGVDAAADRRRWQKNLSPLPGGHPFASVPLVRRSGSTAHNSSMRANTQRGDSRSSRPGPGVACSAWGRRQKLVTITRGKASARLPVRTMARTAPWPARPVSAQEDTMTAATYSNPVSQPAVVRCEPHAWCSVLVLLLAVLVVGGVWVLSTFGKRWSRPRWSHHPALLDQRSGGLCARAHGDAKAAAGARIAARRSAHSSPRSRQDMQAQRDELDRAHTAASDGPARPEGRAGRGSSMGQGARVDAVLVTT